MVRATIAAVWRSLEQHQGVANERRAPPDGLLRFKAGSGSGRARHGAPYRAGLGARFRQRSRRFKGRRPSYARSGYGICLVGSRLLRRRSDDGRSNGGTRFGGYRAVVWRFVGVQGEKKRREGEVLVLMGCAFVAAVSFASRQLSAVVPFTLPLILVLHATRLQVPRYLHTSVVWIPSPDPLLASSTSSHISAAVPLSPAQQFQFAFYKKPPLMQQALPLDHPLNRPHPPNEMHRPTHMRLRSGQQPPIDKSP